MLSPTQAAKPERRAVNLSVSSKLIDEARAQKLNLSRVLEEALELRLKSDREQRWLQENKAAIEARNAHVEQHGLWHRGLTIWY